MIDQALIDQANTYDPLALADRYTTLRHKANTEGGEYCGPCPVCMQGKDCFSVQPLALPFWALWNRSSRISSVRLSQMSLITMRRASRTGGSLPAAR